MEKTQAMWGNRRVDKYSTLQPWREGLYHSQFRDIFSEVQPSGYLIPSLVWFSVPSLEKFLDIHEVQASNCKEKFFSRLTPSILKLFAY